MNIKLSGLIAWFMFLFSLTAYSQNLDTKLTSNSTLLGYLRDTTKFDRTKRWEMGGNWGALHSHTANSMLGMSLNDNTLGSNVTDSVFLPWGVIGDMDDLPSETRLIVTDATWSIPFNHGHGIGTRIDPELYVHPATLEVDKETGLNTGALHGFSHAPIGTVGAGGKYIELRDTAAADTLYGNTNTRVMFRSGNINQEYIQKIFVSDTETIERKYIDPCETGEFLWVGATLRRPGSQSIGNSTDTVMRIFVRRQRQRKKLSEIWTEPFKVCPDSIEYVDVENTLSHPYELGFSYIPEQPTGSGDIARIGIDSLPKMTPQLDTVLFHPTNIFNRLETELRTTQVIPTFVDSTREHVWKRYVDVRNDSGRYKSIVITRGILNALLPASTGPGSAWTEFDALLVLPADSTDKFTPSHFSKKYVANQTLLTLANRHTGVLNLAMPERRNSEHNG